MVNVTQLVSGKQKITGCLFGARRARRINESLNPDRKPSTAEAIQVRSVMSLWANRADEQIVHVELESEG